MRPSWQFDGMTQHAPLIHIIGPHSGAVDKRQSEASLSCVVVASRPWTPCRVSTLDWQMWLDSIFGHTGITAINIRLHTCAVMRMRMHTHYYIHLMFIHYTPVETLWCERGMINLTFFACKLVLFFNGNDSRMRGWIWRGVRVQKPSHKKCPFKQTSTESGYVCQCSHGDGESAKF